MTINVLPRTGRHIPAAALTLVSALAVGAASPVLGPRYGAAAVLSVFVASLAVAVTPPISRRAREVLNTFDAWDFVIIAIFGALLLPAFFLSTVQRSVSELETQPVNLVNLAKTAILAIAAIVAVLKFARAGKAQGNRPVLPIVAFGLLGSLAVLSSLWSSNFFFSVANSVPFAVHIAILSMLTLSVTDSSKPERYWNLLIFLITALLVVVWISALVNPASGFEHVGSALSVRLTGTFPRLVPNGIGELAAILVVVAAARLSTRNSGNQQYSLLAVVLVVGIASLVFAQARTSWLATLVGLSFVLIANRRTLLVVMVALLVTILVAYAPTAFFSIISRGEERQLFVGTFSGRSRVWEEAWDFGRESPVVGHGYYTGVRLDLNERQVLGRELSTTDGVIAATFVELGIVGLAALVLACWALARTVTGAWRRSGGAPGTEIVAVMLIVAVRSATGPTFTEHNINLLIIGIALAWAVSRLRAGGAADQPGRRPRHLPFNRELGDSHQRRCPRAVE